MRLGELCAGYGGLGMAVEEVFGATTAWFSEFEEAPSKILAHRWPGVPNHGDMTKIDWAAIEPVDIISGGTPCQDLSAAGRRAGMTEGTRSNLWVQMREAIAIQKPTYVVWENVRGAFSAKANSDLEHCPRCMGETGSRGPDLRALGRVLGDLSDLGFDAEWRGLRAADVGACHARYRVFVLAKNRDGGRSGRRTTLTGHGETPGANLAALRADDRPGSAGAIEATTTPAHRDNPRRGEHRRTIPVQTEHSPVEYAGLDAAEAYRAGYEHGWREALAHAGSPALGKHSGEPLAEEAGPRGRDGFGDSDGERTSTDWGPYAPAIRRWERTIGRPAPRPTEPTGRNGGERLSPRFTEWMMGLPDGWVTDPAIGISRNEQLKACGNGVVPQQAIAALRDMLAAFEATRNAA